MKKLTLKMMVVLMMVFSLVACGNKKEDTKQEKSTEKVVTVPMHENIKRTITGIKMEKWNDGFKLNDLTGKGTYKVYNMNELIAYFLVDAELSEFGKDGSGCFGLHVDKYKELMEDASKRVRNDLAWTGYEDFNGNGMIFISKPDMSFIFTIPVNLETEDGIDWYGISVYYNGYQHNVAASFATR